MSQWTHVAGVIRIDDFGSISHEELQKIIGKTVKFTSSLSVWNEYDTAPELFTPTGSEGGIEYIIYDNPEKSDMNRYNIMIIGDLRDYDDANAIKAWFENILYGNGLMIRDAVISIDVEYKNKIVMTYKEESNSQV